DNLQTFDSAKLLLIPQASAATSTLTLFVCPAQSSQIATGGCVGPTTQAFASIANQLLEIDVTAALASHLGTPGVTYVAVLAFTSTTSTDRIAGLRFAYAPKKPTGVATLGANTFTGAQTAPSFVGSGASLTGVAKLGANTFSGTQTAP